MLGTDHVDAQLGDGLDPAVLLALPRATIDEACAASTVVLLGPDLKEELPVLYLRLRDAAEKRRTRLVELASHDTGLTPYTWKSLRHRPGEQAALARSLLDPAGRLPDGTGVTDADAADIRDQLAKGNVVVVVGRGSTAESAAFTHDAVAVLPRSGRGRQVPGHPASRERQRRHRHGSVARAPAGRRQAGRGG